MLSCAKRKRSGEEDRASSKRRRDIEGELFRPLDYLLCLCYVVHVYLLLI